MIKERTYKNTVFKVKRTPERIMRMSANYGINKLKDRIYGNV